MKTLKFSSIAFLSLFIASIITSCDKKEDSDLVTISQAEEASFADNVYESITNDVDNVIIGESSSLLKNGGLGDGCAVVTIEYPDSTRFPRIITIDFGEEGCTIVNNNSTITKKGKIIIEVSAPFFESGATRTTTFENLYINDNKIEGTRTATNEGRNDDGFLYFSISLENGKITTDEGVEISREYERTRIWIAGEETPRYHWDDEFMLSGTGSGVSSDGYSYTRTTTEPIYIARNCPWFKSGVVETVVGEDTIVIDFGDGTCDNLATRTINGGEPEEFVMEFRYRRRTGNRN